jgi:hypothetical protein
VKNCVKNIKGTSNNSYSVTPAQAEVQVLQYIIDSRFHGNDIFRGILDINNIDSLSALCDLCGKVNNKKWKRFQTRRYMALFSLSRLSPAHGAGPYGTTE